MRIIFAGAARAAFICVGLFLAQAHRTDAQNARVAQVNLDYLTQNARTIVHGNVVSAALEPHPHYPNLQTVVVTVQVTKTLKGPAVPVLTFRQYVWNAKDTIGAGGYRKAEEILLFLNPESPYGLTSPVGMEQGYFRIVHDAQGNAFALNGRGNIGLFSNVEATAAARGATFSSQSKKIMATAAGKVPLGTLEELIVTLAGARP